MISCTLQGRTGNQMFQIAAAYAHAKRNGFEFVAPPFSSNEQLWPSHRFPKLRYAKIMGNWFHEPHFHYSPIPPEDNIILSGYFQSSKYFEDCAVDLISIFGFMPMVHPGTCAVHVRRTDYITYSKEFNLLPVSWYLSAMEEMGDKEYHFYSDDIAFVRKHFPGHIYHEGLPMNDLHDGATKENCIMSASSFSWWMAYMGTNENQKVIAPKKWFGEKNQHHNTEDLYEQSWIKM